MSSKAEKTTAYIIETVAPLFTSHGYIGTSMSDLTEATKLTKGALYGNFENKEALALAAFEFQQKKLLSAIDKQLNIEGSTLDKIFSLTKFYKYYNHFIGDMGGCPIVNIGVDALNNYPTLAAAVSETVKIIEGKIALVLENGINTNELSLPVPPLQFAKQFFTMIQGGVVNYTITRDSKYLFNTMAYLDQLVTKEIKK